jgi:CRP/FNR family transcriptional regulator, dissimilatory nitrate respiration regulator
MIPIDEIRDAPLLRALSEPQLERIAQRATRVQLDEGQWLFRQGDPAERFFLVREGRLRLFRLSPEGAGKIIEIAAPGQTFAEALMFLTVPRYPVCAAALAPATLISFDAADFALMLRGSVDTCFALLGALSQRLRRLVGEIDELTLHSATGRLARYLLGQVRADRPDFALDLRKGVLASRLSIQPETFSRIVKRLADDGVLEIKGNLVRVLDLEVLAALCERPPGAELGP